MSLDKNINGLHQYILNRDEMMFNTIATEFKLEVSAVRAAAYAAEDNCKPKPIKPQARKPKREITGEKAKTRKKSGFHLFSQTIRSDAKELLINNPKERKIKNKNGDVEELVFESKNIDENGVVNPGFSHIHKKCTAMWWALSDEERGEWVNKAKLWTAEPAVETAESTETTTQTENESSVEESEKVTPVKSKLPPKKGKGEGRNLGPKKPVAETKNTEKTKPKPAAKTNKPQNKPQAKPTGKGKK